MGGEPGTEAASRHGGGARPSLGAVQLANHEPCAPSLGRLVRTKPLRGSHYEV
jgi:hypothetical protein